MKTTHRTVLVSVPVLALVLSGCSDGAAGTAGGDSYNWDFTITVSDTSSWYMGAEKFAEILAEESEGRITVNVVANEQLSGGDPAAGVEQLMNGDKAFSYNSTIIYSGIDERFGAINAPFLYSDYAQAEQAIEAGALDAYTEVAAENGVQLLGFGESGFRQISTTDTPIEKVADIKGLKMRVPGSSLFLDVWAELGADPISMNFAEVFTSLQNGTIDGQENPVDVFYSNGLAEVQSQLTIANYIYDPLILGMNKDLFDSLSAEDQELVQRAATEANALQIEENRKRTEKQLEELSSSVTVTELGEEQIEQFRDAMDPIYEKYASVWGDDLLAAVQPAD